MDQQNTLSSNGRIRQALTGVRFAAFFIAGDVLGGVLTSVPLPLPDAPTADVVRYYDDSRTAVLVRSGCQILSALSLFVFAGCIVVFVRRMRSEGSALPGLTRAGGILAAAFLLVSALLALALIPVAAGGNLTLVSALRQMNFLTGGTLHVVSLGLLMGAASIVARGPKALPGWIVWLGIVQAALAILSLISLIVPFAALLILLGRLLGFVWSIAVGIVLALGKQRAPATGGDHRVLA